MIPGEEKGEISSEFFKKLNQQIVQKDNLIKLLQLQIKNLKAQVDEAGVGADTSELSKTLEAKETEIKTLSAELDGQKSELSRRLQEKDAQIEELNRLLEEHQKAEIAKHAGGADPVVSQLEESISTLKKEVESHVQARKDLEGQIEQIKSASGQEAQNLQAEGGRLSKEVARLQQELSKTQGLLEQREKSMAALEAAGIDKSRSDQELVKLENRVSELEQDIANLKGLLQEKEDQIASMASSQPQLAESKFQLTELQNRLAEVEPRLVRAEELEKLNSQLSAEAAQVPRLKQRIAALEGENNGMAEAAMKLTALEGEKAALIESGENRIAEVKRLQEQLESLKRQYSEYGKKMTLKDNEVAELRAALDAQKDHATEDPVVRQEIEQLTGKVADQLLAIQKFEELLRKSQEQLGAKEQEINILRSQAHRPLDSEKVIPVSGDSEVISSFIDFFDGLDSFLSDHPIPELASLHRKLLDRLIIPNQIQYIPVVSEEFDSERHIATDFFRSDKFPERTIVFEVEKGYRKGEAIVKKSKCWVVQNLFQCRACNSLQSNADSRFCHMCGQKIVAPNGLPVDSLPVFEPTPTTYLRFAERMIEKGEHTKAKEYLKTGLTLDPQFIPILICLAEVHAHGSEFAEAIDLLRQAVSLKPDPILADRIQALEVKNTIFMQARSLNLPKEEFEKLVNLIQK